MGHLRLHPHDWARWTLRDFWLAYKAWKDVNVTQPWAIARSISYYTVNAMGAKIGSPDELYAIDGKRKKVHKAILRPWTKEEKEEYEEIQKQNNGQ